MNPRKISLFLLIISIVFTSLQTFSQSDTTVVISDEQEICMGAQPELLTSVVDPVPDKYQWQNTTSVMMWTNIDTATREVFQPPELEMTTMYRLIVTYNDKEKNGPRSATDTSNVLVITVFDNFEAGTISSTVTQPICYGDDGGTLTANPSGGSENYIIKWICGGDTLGTGSTYDVGDLYETKSFWYYVSDEKGCGEGLSDTVTIEVYYELIAGEITGGNTPICSGQDGGLLRSHPSGGSGAYTIKWYKNDGVFIQEGQSLEVGILTDTTNFYYVIEDEECGLGESDPKTIEVMDMVHVAVSISVTPGDEICEGETAHFKAEAVNGGNNPSYQWRKNDINVGVGSDVFETSDLQTGDKINCQLTSSLECAENNPAESNEIIITVVEPGVASIEIEADNTEVCPDEIITFTSYVQNEGDTPVYEWYINDVSQGIHENIFTLESPADGDVIKASLISDAPCIDHEMVYSEEVTITVKPAPVINDLWIKTTPEIGRPVVLIVCCLDSEQEYTYTWYRNDQEIPGAHGQYYYKAGGIDDGTYYAVVGNSNNCTSGSETYTYPTHKNIFVENTDMFVVYPNPSGGKFEIELNDEEIPVGVSSITVNVYTITGEKVFSGTIINSNSEIDLTNLRAGMYFLELQITKGQRQVKKLLIEK